MLFIVFVCCSASKQLFTFQKFWHFLKILQMWVKARKMSWVIEKNSLTFEKIFQHQVKTPSLHFIMISCASFACCQYLALSAQPSTLPSLSQIWQVSKCQASFIIRQFVTTQSASNWRGFNQSEHSILSSWLTNQSRVELLYFCVAKPNCFRKHISGEINEETRD